MKYYQVTTDLVSVKMTLVEVANKVMDILLDIDHQAEIGRLYKNPTLNNLTDVAAGIGIEIVEI